MTLGAAGLWRFLLALALCVLVFAGSVLAQDTAGDAIDYTAWDRVAGRAEKTVEAGGASDDALEALRSQIAQWRDQFLTAEGQNKDRIDTLRAQIGALGPAPAEGEPAEAADVAQRRTELEEQLNRLSAPVVAAEEAYTRADGLIREIDSLIRERRTDRLLHLGPSPLNPTLWPKAFQAVAGSAENLAREMREAVSSRAEQRELLSNLPLVGIFLALGVVLLARGRIWISRLVTILRERTRPGTGVWSFLVSLGEVAVPMLGLVLLVAALQSSGMVGVRAAPYVDNLAGWGTLILLVWGLGDQVFASSDRVATIKLEGWRRTEARVDVLVLGLCLVAHNILTTMASVDGYTDTITYVLDLPILAAAGVTLFRLGQLLSARPPDEEDTGQSFIQRLTWFVGRAAMVVAIVGPLMVAVGYGAAGTALIYPAISSLLLIGLLTLLQRFTFDIYELVTGRTEADQGGLIPVLVSFALAIASVPLFALLWGAREADLTEVWARFREGYTLGDARISPTDFLTFIVVFAIGYIATRVVQGALRSSVLPKTRIDTGGQTAILSGIGYVGVFLAGLVAITSAGIDLTALGYVAGALSVGIGFGLQNIVSNFVSGIILLIERPISKGDWIEVGGEMGYVRDISVRSTRIETFDRTDVIVPNSDFISGKVTNYTRGNTIGRVIVAVGVAYGTDTKRVEEILNEIANSHPMVLANPPPTVYFRGFGASSLDFEIRAILRDVNWVLAVHSDMNHSVAQKFAEEGIEIPFPQQDLWLRNPEALSGRPAPVPTPAPPRPEAPKSGAPDSPEDDAD